MPPRRNHAHPNAVRIFNCAVCDKGYPRQLDYENHLRSYDHNHRQRMADLQKLNAENQANEHGHRNARHRAHGGDMRSIPIEGGKKVELGPRFLKIGARADTSAFGSRFKKVGVTVTEAGTVKKAPAAAEADVAKVDGVEVAAKEDEEMGNNKENSKPTMPKEGEIEETVENDVAMVDDENDKEEPENIDWEQYDFTKPTDCDHENCEGCKTDGIYDDGWLVVNKA